MLPGGADLLTLPSARSGGRLSCLANLGRLPLLSSSGNVIFYSSSFCIASLHSWQ